MKINGNTLPPKLMRLIEDGSWWELPEKKDYLEAIYKGPVNSLKSLELFDLGVMKFESEGLAYHCSPSYQDFEGFKKIFEGAPDNRYAPGDIDFSKFIVIGDLGLGSDAPLGLDFRENKDSPSVVILHWFRSDNEVMTRWLKIADTFDEFWDVISVRR